MMVLELIDKYPKIFPKDEYGKIKNFSVSVPVGWISVLDKMCGAIQKHIDTYRHITDKTDKPCEQVVCTVLKEKFGELRFYYTGGNSFVSGMVQLTSHICDNICCVCGSEEDLGMTMSYITVCCKDCFENGKAASDDWKSMEEVNNLTYERNGTTSIK